MTAPKLDYKTLIIATALTGTMGLGTNMIDDEVDPHSFEATKTEFRSDLQIQDQRSEKRYKRGMALGSEMKDAIKELIDRVTELEIENARLDERLKTLTK